ncbi:UbiA family prenyltransferase [Nocardia transvalensis]|uniref:UbiA family prenyltransferase n=1 Tax=Nocardia transvalensis TaxID=37333 RepID=UPI001893EDA5|nr:UbiA family prenyltransferase [Nocardia transvalensis]MBF6331958.1 UbiA family prenyltransferase [Nocardia transvalensis]
MIDTAVRFAIGPTQAERVSSLLWSARISERIWFDILPPLTFFCVLYTQWVPPWKILVGGLALGTIHVGATLVNDAMDVEVDRASSEKSRSERELATGRGRAGDFIVLGALLSLTGIALGFALSPLVGALVAGAVVVATAYNVPPLRLSGRPIWPQLMWPTIWLLIFAIAGLVIETGKWHIAWPYAVFVALFAGLGEGIAQDVRDADNDAAGGRRTTPVVFGVRRSCWTAWAAQIAGLPAWLLFCVLYPMPLIVAVVGAAILLGWGIVLATLTRTLSVGFDKRAARLTHVGTISTFAAMNVVTIAGVIVR